MTPAIDILVVGDAMLDVLATPVRAPVPGSDVPAAIEVGTGGQGANLAVRLARGGMRVGLVAPIGTDTGGRLLRTALEAAGVAHLGPDVDASGAVVVLRDDVGERTMLSRRAPLGPAVGLLQAAGTPAWVLVSGYALLDPDADAVVTAMGRAARRGVVGCALTPVEAPMWRARLDALGPHLLVLNRDEADVLEPVPEVDVLAVTDAGGAVCRTPSAEVRVDVPPGPPAVDTTGAGDAFAAALVGALARSPGWPPGASELRAALAAAVASAASVVRVVGAQTPVPGEGAGGTLLR